MLSVVLRGLGDSGMQSISRGGPKGIPGSGEGVGTLHPVAGKFTNRQLQDAVDALHAVLGSPSVRARKVTTVSVTPDGKVIISNNNSVPSIAQQKLCSGDLWRQRHICQRDNTDKCARREG